MGNFQLSKNGKLILLRTGIPPFFADAPIGYYEEWYDYIDVFVDANYYFYGTEWDEVLQEESKKRKKQPKYEGITNYDYGEREIDATIFPQQYFMIIEN